MTMYQTVSKYFLEKLLILFISIGCLAMSASQAAANCNGTTPSCSAALGYESAGGCQPNKSGKSLVGSASAKVGASCIASTTSGGCFNSVPVSSVGSYNRSGYRSPSRNHYGSDLGTGGKTNVLAYAAADGTVSGCRTSSGGGRTTVIVHTKHCSGTNKKPNYSTVYRHLFKQTKCSGSVRKNETIGVVGGSNSSSAGGAACDNPAQAKNCKPYYAIHLHFEVVNGAMSASSTYVGGSTTMQASCGGLQALCGGCPVSTKSCGGRMSPYSNGQSATGNEANAGAGNGTPNGPQYDQDGNIIPGTDGSYEPQCVLSDYLDSTTCTSCDIFKTIFNAASNLAATAIAKLAGPSKTIVLTGFLIWLAIYILKQISSFQGAAPGDLLKGIILQGTRVAIVVFILSGALYQIMDLTINPVVQTGLTFANMLNPDSNCDISQDYMQGIVGYDSKSGLQSTSQGGLPRSMGESIICTIKNLEDSVSVLASLGNYSTCLSFHEKSVWEGVIPHLGYLLSGIGLWLAGMFLLFAFPWCLIDCILQLCIAAAMIPCSIAAFAFKSTASYTRITWNFFMNAMFTLVFMAVLIFILNSMFKEWIGLSSDSLSGFDPALLITAYSENGLAWWGIGAFKIFAFVFLFVCFVNEVPSMAGKFSDNPPFGSKGIGRMVGGTVAQAGAKLGIGAGHIAKKGADTVGEAANSLAGNWVRSKTNQVKGMAISALGGRKIRNENGEVVGYQARFKVPGFTQTRTVTKDANGVWTQTKETHQTTKADKEFKPMKDENGNSTYGVKTFDAESGKEIYEEMDKSIDQATGNIVYSSKDGKSKLVTDANGTILKYKRAADSEMQQERHPGSVQNTNDSLMHKRVMVDADGHVIGTDIQFKNVSAKYLVNKDGSTNMHAFNQIMNGVSDKNKADAMAAMAITHMQARGQNMDNRFKDRKVTMDKNGGVRIEQINRDGSKQIVSAQMVNGQMVIQNQITDSKGNITIQKSNGIQSKTTSFTKQKDGTFLKSVKYGFTDEAHSRSRLSSPLDANGAWGYGIDPQKAMAGFNAQEFQEHLNQLQNGQKDKDKDKLTEVEMLMQLNTAPVKRVADEQRGQTLLESILQPNTAPASLDDLSDLNAAVRAERLNGISDTPEQLAAQELIKKEIQNIAKDPSQLQKMNGKELKEVVVIIDTNILNEDGSRNTQLDNLLENAMSLMTPQQKAELMLAENLSPQLSAKLIS